LGHERRDTAERRLLGRDAFERRPGLGVGDRGLDELGEGAHPRLGAGRLPMRFQDAARDHAPHPAFHDDGRGDGLVEAEGTGALGERAAGVGVVVHARRPARPQRAAGGAVALQRQPLADGEQRAVRAPGGHDRGGRLVLGGEHVHDVEPEALPDRLDDRREDLGGRRLAGDHRRDVPQRRLLVGQHASLPRRGARAAFGPGRDLPDEDRRQDEHAQHERRRAAHRPQRRQEVPVEGLDRDDADGHGVDDAADVGDGQHEQREGRRQHLGGHV
jgi:hypothetical protein